MRNQRLRELEAESLEILRELGHGPERVVFLYSVGKDSSVLLHLLAKAFHPAKIPFPALHVDTGMKFEAMYDFRDRRVREVGIDLIVERNEAAIAERANPFDLGTRRCCTLLKTDALLQALRKHDFKIAIGGARREEERSRAKERVFSVREAHGGWNPKMQRPEFWQIYNARLAGDQTMRVFPLSNWTELDIWNYIAQENIPVVDLYFTESRDVVRRGTTLQPHFPGLPLAPSEKVEKLDVRFRTLGCWPCTGAVASNARSTAAIIRELEATRVSERSTRAIDHDEPASMEKKKIEGYF